MSKYLFRLKRLFSIINIDWFNLDRIVHYEDEVKLSFQTAGSDAEYQNIT